MRKTRRLLAPIAGLAVLGLALTGCAGSGGSDGGSGSDEASGAVTVSGGPEGKSDWKVEVDEDLAAQAKDLTLKSGKLNLVTSASVPPYGYQETGTDTLRGSDIDIANAIGAKLGLDVEFSAMEFTGILPAIQANRFDFSIASMGDTPEREKIVDFVDYSTDSNSIVTTKGNPKNISGIDSLCGLDVSSVEGSVFLGLLEEQNTKCDTPINISIFQDNANALLQVQTGRADATMYQTGIALYLIKTDSASKNLEVIDSEEYGKGYNAIAFNKDNPELRDLVQQALTALKDDGVYADIHDAWGLKANMLDEITVNDGLRFNQPT